MAKSISSVLASVRKPTAPPSKRHGDDKYTRKLKHKGNSYDS